MYKIAILSVLCAACAFAQNTAVFDSGPRLEARMEQGVKVTTGGPQFGVVGVTGAMVGPAGIQAGAPYSAQVVTQRLQVLGDGNRIEETTTGSVARDGQGRVRRDESLPALAGNGEAPHIVMIDDPVAQVHWTLDAQTKTATKMPMPPMKALPGMSAALPAPPLSVATSTKAMTFFSYSAAPAGVMMAGGKPGPDNAVKTDLGTQTVEGVLAQGTRITHTIAAGEIGNQLPITITTETWFSPDLKVLVSSKSSDPRIGDTTYKLTNIQRSEPDPSLFQVPADYTIKDQPENTFIYRTAPPKED